MSYPHALYIWGNLVAIEILHYDYVSLSNGIEMATDHCSIPIDENSLEL